MPNDKLVLAVGTNIPTRHAFAGNTSFSFTLITAGFTDEVAMPSGDFDASETFSIVV